MHKAQEQVRNFHVYVAKAPSSPSFPKLRNPMLQARLILEEALETIVALVGDDEAYKLLITAENKLAGMTAKEPDIVDAIDGICDLIYVCYGTAEDMGVDLEPFFDTVHNTNMQKVNAPVDSNGKVTKPEGWEQPKIAELLLDIMQRRSW